MDGLKKFLRTLRRVHFWIICPLVVVMGLVGWVMTIGTLKKEKQKNRSEIESKFQTVSSLGSEPIHPNVKIEQGMDKMIVARREEVAAAWQEKWDQQTREGGVLTWPDFDWKEDKLTVKVAIKCQEGEDALSVPSSEDNLGLFLIHALMDEVQSQDEGRTLVLGKDLSRRVDE